MDKAMRVSSVERETGKRANYHVYYSRNGKIAFDASWAKDREQACSYLLAFAKELRWKNVEIVSVISLVFDVPLG